MHAISFFLAAKLLLASAVEDATPVESIESVQAALISSSHFRSCALQRSRSATTDRESLTHALQPVVAEKATASPTVETVARMYQTLLEIAAKTVVTASLARETAEASAEVHRRVARLPEPLRARLAVSDAADKATENAALAQAAALDTEQIFHDLKPRVNAYVDSFLPRKAESFKPIRRKTK